jgi:cell division control protein 6
MSEDPDEGMLSWDESVFRDEHVFEIDYVPETFDHRETQLESLKYALRPAVRGSRPLNTMTRGPPGTGKTTAVQKLLTELDSQRGVQTVRVNCQVDSTRYGVFSRIFQHIFEYEPPSSGISFKKLFGQIADQLVDAEDVLVVALDDINYLIYENEASDTLYSLLRAHEAQAGAKVGVIVISSDLSVELIDELDNRVQSVFRPEEVYFSKYDATEIIDILQQRASRGFHDGVLGSPELDRVTELTAADGDLRVGIDLLRRAGLQAEMRGSRTIAIEDIDTAYEKSKYVHLSRRLQGLSQTESALVEVVAADSGATAGEIYELFHAETGLGYTRYSEVVNKLDDLGIIDASYTDIEGRGRTRSMSLAYDADAVMERL